MREEGDNGLVVIPCVRHKTQTLAQLVITEDVEDMLQYYHDNIRTQIVPAEEINKNYFFLKHSGKMYTQVYRHIKEALGSDNMMPPVSGLYSILVSSDARRDLDAKKHANATKHLSHSMQTSAKY